MLRLRTFGGLALENGAPPPTGAALQRTPLALLAVIAAAGERGISRDRLLALFWPESDAERARGSLKQALYALRRDLGDHEIVLGTDDLRLNSSVIGSDVGDFEAAIRAGELERAVELYRGAFLDGIHLGNGEFSRWRDEEAERVATRYRGAVALLARTAEDRGDHAAAVRWCRILAAAEPLSTSVTLSLMKALVRAGDRTAALDHARTYEHLVRLELETSPDSAVLTLAAQLRREVGPPSDQTSGQNADRIAPPLAMVAPPPSAAGRSRFLIATAAALLLAAGLGGIALARARRPLDPNVARIALGPRAAAIDSLLVSRLAEILPGPDRSLRVIKGGSGRAKYVAMASAQIEGDSVRLAVDVTDASTGKRLSAIEPVVAGLDAPEVGLRKLGERLGVVLAAQRNPLFASWADAAAMPTTWASYRELEAGVQSWGSAAEDHDPPPAHFDAAASLDPNSATPLVWKALILANWEQAAGLDSVLTQLKASNRRWGAWDRAMFDVLEAWDRGDLAGGHDAGHHLLEVVPNSEWAVLVAYDATSLGRHREALELMSHVSTSSGWTRSWGTVVRFQALHLSGDYAGELALAREGLRRDPDSRFQQQILVRALAGLGRAAEVEKICTSSMALAPLPGLAREVQPCGQAIHELWGHGYPAAARGLAKKFLAAVLGVDSIIPEGDALTRAEVLQYVGDWQESERALAGIPESNRDDAGYLRFLLLAKAARGDRTAVVATRDRLATLRSNLDGLSVGEWPMYEAGVAALLGDKEKAVNWIAKGFRDGFRYRTYLHWFAAFEPLHGYSPFEAFLHPVDAPEHRVRFAVDR